MDRLFNLLTLVSFALIAQVLLSVRKAHIRVEYSVSWLVAGLILLLLSVNRNLMLWISKNIGLDSVATALILLIMFVFLVVFYRFSIRISDLKDANIALSQRIAILEYHLQASHEERKS